MDSQDTRWVTPPTEPLTLKWLANYAAHCRENPQHTHLQMTQSRFPRSKKRRILTKWRRDLRNYKSEFVCEPT